MAQRGAEEGAEPEREPAAEEDTGASRGGGEGSRLWMTGKMLAGLKGYAFEDLCQRGFLFTPGANFDNGIVEGGCPQGFKHCICRMILCCETDPSDPDAPPLIWSCAKCGQMGAGTEFWQQIRTVHVSHVCRKGAASGTAAAAQRTDEFPTAS